VIPAPIKGHTRVVVTLNSRTNTCYDS